MKSFEDYRKELTMPQLLVSANCCRHAFEAGQQSKQSEVDELQDRIDEALKRLNLAYPESWGYCVDEAINILKGENYESW